MTKKEELRILVDSFRQDYKNIHSNSYDETSVRIDFINKFFSIFGWDVNNDLRKPQPLRDVIHEANIYIDEEDGESRNKKPDYSFLINGNPQFFVEAKKPTVNITRSKKSAFQIRRYGWSAGMQFGVLTNFETLVIYDTTVMPKVTDETNISRTHIFNYEEYVTKFDEIWKLLSKSEVERARFVFKDSRQKNSFDNYFLEQIRGWRSNIGSSIFKNNSKMSIEEINIFVQRLINKSLFLRICEDKDLEKYEQLKNISKMDDLVELFKKSDRRYNSGIFSLINENKNLFDFDILKEMYSELYFPKSSYNFSVIPSSLLAKVYDLFLSERLIIVEDDIITELKPELKDSFGAVATPESIANEMARNAIDIRLDNQTKNILELKICDICCGSGIFLVSAFQYLSDLYTTQLSEKMEENIQNGLLTETFEGIRLTFKAKKKLLSKTIYGVDIDPSAIEVCKFSLLLECISNLSQTELLAFEREGGILPNLDRNIVFGNSLVDNSFYDFLESESEGISDVNIEEISPFDLENAFSSNKFDVLLGNPPYVRVQKMARYSPIEHKFIRSKHFKFELSSISAIDKYYLFLERAVSLLSDFGVCGYIVPNKFIHEKNGRSLRKFVTSRRLLKKVVNFNEIQLFPEVLVYTCMLFLSNKESEIVDYISVSSKNEDSFTEQMRKRTQYKTSTFGEEPWYLYSSKIKSWYEKLDTSFIPLSSIANIFVGLQTSNDRFYFITPIKETEDFVEFVDCNKQKRKIEKGILRPAIQDLKLKKYQPILPNRYLIYPYVKDYNEKGRLNYRLYEKEELQTLFPLAYKYLLDSKSSLLKRNINGLIDIEADWFRYGRSQSIDKFDSGEVLIWPVITLHTNMVYEETPIAFTGGGNGPYYGLKLKENCQMNLKYVQAILNSDFISEFIEESSVYFNGGYFSAGKQFVQIVPIKDINFSNSHEVYIHDRIVKLSETLTKLNRQFIATSSTVTGERLRRRIELTEKRLDVVIKQLYGVE